MPYCACASRERRLTVAGCCRHVELRAQLAASLSQHTAYPPPPPPPASQAHPHDVLQSGSRPSHIHDPHHHNIDPAIGAGVADAEDGVVGAATAEDLSGSLAEDDGDGGRGPLGGKRELSQSKRAAQNRAAQVCRL